MPCESLCIGVLLLTIPALALAMRRPPPRPPAYLSARTIKDLANAQAEFGLTLLAKVPDIRGPHVLSPFELAMALFVPHLAACDEAKRELNNVLAAGVGEQQYYTFLFLVASGIFRYPDRILQAFNDGTSAFIDTNDGAQRLKFLDALQRFDVDWLQEINMSKPITAARLINEFIEKRSGQANRNVVKPEHIQQGAMLVVALPTFTEKWEYPFVTDMSRSMPFFHDRTKESMVPMMYGFNPCRYYADDQVEVLGLPYASGIATMFVFLPKQRFGLAKFLPALNGSTLLDYMYKTERALVAVHLPKFFIKENFDASRPLQQLGVSAIFKNSGLNGATGSTTRLSHVLHATSLSVDEWGTGPKLQTIREQLGTTREDRVDTWFIANHPFLYAIATQDVLLFLGTYK